MRSAIIIVGGLLLLGAFLLVGRYVGRDASDAMAKAALAFVPVWLVAAGVNMWMGVARAGYSVADEAPIFAIIFAVPAAVALFVWWRMARG